MTVEGDVLNLFIPYPSFTSPLVKERHMYVCTAKGGIKEVLMCTSKKPKHARPNFAPINRVEIYPDQYREKSPFSKTTLIDCDHGFLLSNIHVPTSILTNPRCLCEEYLDSVLTEILHPDFKSLALPREELLYINDELDKVNLF